MRFNEVKKLVLRNDLHETTQNKSKSINNENNAFQSELFLLQQEYQKRCKEISLWFGTEKRKIMIRHNQKLQNIQIL